MNKRIYIKLIIILSLVALTISACTSKTRIGLDENELNAKSSPEITLEAVSDSETTEAIDFRDGTGREVHLVAKPERIVVAGKATPYVLDIVYLFPQASKNLVGLEVRGFDTQSFLELVDPDVNVKLFLERDSGPEQIAPLKPDLVILKDYSLAKLGAALEEIGLPVMGVNLETPDDFYNDVLALGAIFGDLDRANEIISFYKTKVENVDNLISPISDDKKPDVLFLQYTEDGGDIALKVPPQNYLQTLLVQKSGGNPVWLDQVDQTGGWMIVGLEQIASWNPDKIFVVQYGGDSTEVAANLLKNPLWEGLKSVENNEIYGIPADYASWDLIDPRWILGLEWLATKIQPLETTSLDIKSEVREFYGDLYMLTEAQIEAEIFPKLDELR